MSKKTIADTINHNIVYLSKALILEAHSSYLTWLNDQNFANQEENHYRSMKRKGLLFDWKIRMCTQAMSVYLISLSSLTGYKNPTDIILMD